MNKLSKINEGMFSGIIRRSNSVQVKKEDDINQMNKEDLKEYMETKYEPLDTKNNKIYYFIDSDNLFLSTIKDYDYSSLNYHKNEVIISYSIINKIPDFYKLMSSDFNITKNSNIYVISPKEGEIDNSFFIKVFDKILSLTDEPAFRKIS